MAGLILSKNRMSKTALSVLAALKLGTIAAQAPQAESASTNEPTTLATNNVAQIQNQAQDDNDFTEIAKTHVEGIAINVESDLVTLLGVAVIGLALRGIPFRISFSEMHACKDLNLAGGKIQIVERDGEYFSNADMRWGRAMNHALQALCYANGVIGKPLVFPRFFQISFEKRLAQLMKASYRPGYASVHVPTYVAVLLSDITINPFSHTRINAIKISAKDLDLLAGTRIAERLEGGAKPEQIQGSFNLGDALRTFRNNVASASARHEVQRIVCADEAYSSRDVTDVLRTAGEAILTHLARPGVVDETQIAKRHLSKVFSEKAVLGLAALFNKDSRVHNNRQVLSVGVYTLESVVGK